MIIRAPQRFLLGYQPTEVPRRSLIAGRSGDRQQPLSGLARNFGDVFVGPLCGGGEGGVFVGGDALE